MSLLKLFFTFECPSSISLMAPLTAETVIAAPSMGIVAGGFIKRAAATPTEVCIFTIFICQILFYFWTCLGRKRDEEYYVRS